MTVTEAARAPASGAPSAASASRAAVEDFLFYEASLLDEWRLDEWLKLFRDDASYLIPALDSPDASPQDSLYLVNDNMARLRSRVNQFTGRSMWAENPLSRTRRCVANVRVLSADQAMVRITANFAVYRMRHREVHTYVGRYEHLLEPVAGGFLFRERKSILDLESLNPHGKVSIIL
jgi:p-cumate 2,3-dioxygenase beta subunit